VERRPCSRCGTMKEEGDFRGNEWKMATRRQAQRGVCRDCARREADTLPCSACGQLKTQQEYQSARMWQAAAQERKCRKCAHKQVGWWKCIQCKESFHKAEFSRWLERRCTDKKDGKARCNRCKVEQEKEQKRVAASSHRSVQGALGAADAKRSPMKRKRCGSLA